jgi:REP element-mobilizing transposase RayT
MNKKGYNHYRRSIRLKEYDYSQAGFYFVTICTQNQKCFFGDIKDERMILNPFGKIAKHSWGEIKNHFSQIDLDHEISMPNHIHGIIVINSQCRGLINQAPTSWILMKNPDINLGKIVRYFKA